MRSWDRSIEGELVLLLHWVDFLFKSTLKIAFNIELCNKNHKLRRKKKYELKQQEKSVIILNSCAPALPPHPVIIFQELVKNI